MAESGWYPPGAENDPRAPWNQSEVPHKWKTVVGTSGLGARAQEMEATSCERCHVDDQDDKAELDCPGPFDEDDGPDPDAAYDAERDDRLTREADDG